MQNVFIINFNSLYEILDEIKANLSFKIIKFDNEENFKKLDLDRIDYLVILKTDHKLLLNDIITNKNKTHDTFKGYISKLRYFVDVSKENGGALNDKQVYDLYLNSPYPSILEKIATTVYNKIISFKSDGSDEASNLSSFSSDKLKSQLNAAQDALARRKDNLQKDIKEKQDEHDSLTQ